MLSRALSFIAALVVAFSFQAQAQNQADACDSIGISNAEVNDCVSNILTTEEISMGIAYASAQVRLKQEFGKSYAEGQKEALKRLEKSQKSWAVAAKAQCEVDSMIHMNGTLEGKTQGLCLIKAVQDRTTKLSEVGVFNDAE